MHGATLPGMCWGFGLALVLALAPRPAGAHNFVGAEACASCHAFEYEVWAKGPHARAHLSLTPEQLSDGRCASCHSNVLAALDGSASSDAGASLGEVRVGERDQKRSPLAQALTDKTLLGVQCEQCHGPGKLYQLDYVMRDRELSRALGLVDPTPASCRACHTEGAPSLEAFDYPTLWGRIDHSKAARARWAEQRQGGSAEPTGGADAATDVAPKATPSATPGATSRAPAPKTKRPRRGPTGQGRSP